MSFTESAAFHAIKNGAKQLAQPKPYHLVYSTARGFGNIGSGLAQYVLGHAFKCSKDQKYYRIESVKHIERGSAVFKQGLREFLPGASACVGGCWALYRVWTKLSEQG